MAAPLSPRSAVFAEFRSINEEIDYEVALMNRYCRRAIERTNRLGDSSEPIEIEIAQRTIELAKILQLSGKERTAAMVDVLNPLGIQHIRLGGDVARTNELLRAHQLEAASAEASSLSPQESVLKEVKDLREEMAREIDFSCKQLFKSVKLTFGLLDLTEQQPLQLGLIRQTAKLARYLISTQETRREASEHLVQLLRNEYLRLGGSAARYEEAFPSSPREDSIDESFS
jgi:hypothetical protein